MRIAIAGFQHETNTFAPALAGFEDFRVADSWPGMLQGADVVSGTRGLNLPIAGMATEADRLGGIEVTPVLWCAAEPSGPVSDAAFERIGSMMIDGLRDAGPLDAVCLDLHGAMVTESLDDGEGELLFRLRQALGPEMPIGLSLDLHANISARMVDLATLITIYRTYPHLDMAETGARCLRETVRTLHGTRRFKSFRQAPFLVPLQAQFTGAEPCRALYQDLDDVAESDDEFVELAMGFTAADIPDVGPCVVATAGTQTRADALAEAMLTRLIAAETRFDTELLEPSEAVRAAIAPHLQGPAILADVQDNSGAGATADTTGLLQALVDCGARRALLGVLCDPETAALAHAVGEGNSFQGSLGGKSGLPGQTPFRGRFNVLFLSDGQIAYAGEMYGGGIVSIGPSCLLSVEGIAGDIRIVVSSRRTQCLDRAFFTEFGEDPSQWDIVCVKSTAHFRADFQTDGGLILNVAAPGAFPCRLSEIP